MLVVAPARDKEGMQDLVASNGYSFPVLLDEGAASSAYRIRYVPTLFVIDGEGRIAERIVGAVDYARLTRLLDELSG